MSLLLLFGGSSNNTVMTVSAATLAVAGQNTLFVNTMAVSQGAVAVAGKTVLLAITMGVSPGAVAIAGQVPSLIWEGKPRAALYMRKTSATGQPATYWKGRS